MTPYLTVVIPAYNESQNFNQGVLSEILPFLKAQSFSWELIFVNDGSTDDTKVLLQQFADNNPHTRVITIHHGGKSAAVRAGVIDAKGEIVLFTDFDQSTPIKFCLDFISAHKKGSDVVIGVRGGARSNKSDSLLATIRSKVFLILVQTVALPGIKDSQCGFKSFTKNAATKIFTSLKVCRQTKVSGGYMGAFDVEVLFLARKFGFSIAQLPVSWVRMPSNRLNIWKEPLMMLRDTFKIRLYDILGKYA